MKLYHYAVFLRAKQGTVRRNVAITQRSVKVAASTAQAAVSRHLREPVVVLDTVPLRERAGRAVPTVINPRSKRPTTVRKVSYVLSRRPKARASLILTKRGARPIVSEKELLTPYERASDRVSNALPKRDPGACMAERCVKRGSCGHRRLAGTELITFETRVRVGAQGAVMVIRTLATDERAARRAMRAFLKERGFGHKRLARVSPNYAARPFTSH